jgi:hypothetical protein
MTLQKDVQKNRRVQLAILPNEQMVDEAEKEAQDGN